MDTPQAEPLTIEGKEVSLEILHEDDHVLVVNKPQGIVAHPTSGNWSGTLLNALLAHFQLHEKNGKPTKHTTKPRIVHRLDKNTSGVMVVAKTPEAHRGLASQFERHKITREYEALLWSVPENMTGVIDIPIGRHITHSKLVSTQTKDPKHATTDYRMMDQFGERASRVQLLPRTGRTHQLRVHMTSIGCPILGDTMYGGKKVNNIEGIIIPRMMLHAQTLGFQHPTTGKFQEYSVAPPFDIQNIVQALKSFSP